VLSGVVAVGAGSGVVVGPVVGVVGGWVLTCGLLTCAGGLGGVVVGAALAGAVLVGAVLVGVVGAGLVGPGRRSSADDVLPVRVAATLGGTGRTSR
jgi:hypothetical protein